MIEKEDWLNAIEDFIEELSDEEFQQRIWIRGEGPEVSSYTDLMCGLFDDFAFDSFLGDSWDEFEFSSNLHDKLIAIRDSLNTYNVDDSLYDINIVDDPKWDRIRKNAGEVLIAFREERRVLKQSLD